MVQVMFTLSTGSNAYGSRGSADDCSDQRRLQSELRDHLARSSVPAECGSSGFDANVRFFLGFVDNTAHRESASCLCPATF